jgi:hypothetical protein
MPIWRRGLEDALPAHVNQRLLSEQFAAGRND